MKYRLFPTKSQATVLEQTLDAWRWVYNKALEMRKNAWEQERRSLSYFETKRMLPQWKAAHPFLEIAHSQGLQNVTERVDLAFKAFFRRVKAGEAPGYPRFRGKHCYDSFTYPQANGHRSLNQSIADAAWGQFLQYTSAKAAEAVRTFLKVFPRGTHPGLCPWE
jgi:putative transposase